MKIAVKILVLTVFVSVEATEANDRCQLTTAEGNGSDGHLINMRERILQRFPDHPWCPNGFDSYLVGFMYFGTVEVQGEDAHVVEVTTVPHALNPRRGGFVGLFSNQGELKGSIHANAIQNCDSGRIFFATMQGTYLDFGDERVPGNGVALSDGWPINADLLNWIREPRPGTPIRPDIIHEEQVLHYDAESNEVWNIMLQSAQNEAPEFTSDDWIVTSFGYFGDVEIEDGILHAVEVRGVSRTLPEVRYLWLMLFSEDAAWISSSGLDPEFELMYSCGPLIYLNETHQYRGRNGNALLILEATGPSTVIPIRGFGVGPQDALTGRRTPQ